MFREIPGYNNYFINESGIILDKFGNTLRVSVNKDCLMYVTINGNNEYIHDLVAKTYLKYDNRCIYPIHKDGDLLNNHISNIKLDDKPEVISITSSPNRDHRRYSSSKYIYEVYNDETNDVIQCIGRNEVADLIQYEEISLKNMVGNGKMISLGPYKGYQIRRVVKQEDI